MATDKHNKYQIVMTTGKYQLMKIAISLENYAIQEHIILIRILTQ